MDWHDADFGPLFAAIRAQAPPEDGERMIWALERVVAGARIDPGLLDHLAAAAISALAYRDGVTPRTVTETLFRRSIPDEQWRSDYATLLAG